MTASIARQLALKDLYMTRWTLIASVAAGTVSVAMMPLGSTAFYVGSVCLVCALIILNIMLVMTGVMQEKKDNVLVFLLSLPISTARYWAVKTTTNVVMFVVPWLFLTTAGLVVIDLSAIPNGLIPFMLAISTYILCYYCVLLGVALTTESFFWTTAVIVGGNVSVNFFIPLVFRLPSAPSTVQGATAVWSRDIVATLVIEVLFCLGTLAAAVWFQSRKRDFV